MRLASNAMQTARIALEILQHALVATQIHTCIKASAIRHVPMKHMLLLRPKLANPAINTVLYVILQPLIAQYAMSQDPISHSYLMVRSVSSGVDLAILQIQILEWARTFVKLVKPSAKLVKGLLLIVLYATMDLISSTILVMSIAHILSTLMTITLGNVWIAQPFVSI
jgi:hypothetical protein